MNYLAHAWLAGRDPGWILGAFLGDHVRGDRWRHYPPAVAAGIRFHRRLDAQLDDHPAVRCARRAFGAQRRYAGILLDLGFDHFLARDWAALTTPDTPSLEHFSAACLALLEARRALLPPTLGRFVTYARRSGQLVAYRERAGIDRALRGIAGRMRRPGPLVRGWAALSPHEETVARAFREVWPQFVAEAPALRRDIGEETTRLLTA